MSPLSTAEIARVVGVHPVTLERWITRGRFKLRKTIKIGTKTYRVWTDSDIDRLRAFKAKFYRKGRGRGKQQS
jgi:DNA-binding transcriptional MerR regulator